ncbi:MAG: hypothetical protein HXS54_05995 [Theionarchaea archaeon]|nr:hypothetical protein [Theionarchaea archaeon]DBA34811.1 TPA_asm: hypothetical protein vir521_00017 [Caudoviricetes sp. vir521]
MPKKFNAEIKKRAIVLLNLLKPYLEIIDILKQEGLINDDDIPSRATVYSWRKKAKNIREARKDDEILYAPISPLLFEDTMGDIVEKADSDTRRLLKLAEEDINKARFVAETCKEHCMVAGKTTTLAGQYAMIDGEVVNKSDTNITVKDDPAKILMVKYPREEREKTKKEIKNE